MAAKEEDGNDGVLGELREMAELMQDMISQDELERNQGEKEEVLERSNEQESSSNHQLAGLSTTYNVLVAYNKSDLANLETSNVAVSSGEAVPLSSDTSSSDLTNVEIKRGPITPGKKVTLLRRPMTHVEKGGLGLSLKPIKHDPSLHDKSSAAKRDHQLGDSSDLASKYNLPDDEEVTNPIDYTSSDYDVIRAHLSLLSIENNDSKQLSKIDSSSDHVEADEAQCKTHEHASDFTFDVKQLVNHEKAPPKPSLQRQNAMRQQRYTSELDPMPTRDSITTASSHGYRPSISMTKALTTATDFVPKRNQQVMNPHYSQCQVPSGQYGNIKNSPYTPPNQNESYNMPPQSAALQQLGGSNMAHNDNMMNSPYWRPEQNDRYSMPPQLAASISPYAYYGSVNSFGTSSDNVSNSRFGYEGGVSRNHLSSVQQYQIGDSNVLPPSSIRSRQQRQKQPWSDFSVSPKPTKR